MTEATEPKRGRGRPKKIAEPNTVATTPAQIKQARESVQRESQYSDEMTLEDFVTYEGGDINPLEIPAAMMRPGYIMQWKARSIMGNEEVQRSHLTRHYRTGWRPVEGERGRGYFFMPGEVIPATIEQGGMMLMERPAQIEQYARAEANKKAKGQVRDKLASIGHGNKDTAMPNIQPEMKINYESFEVPE